MLVMTLGGLCLEEGVTGDHELHIPETSHIHNPYESSCLVGISLT